MFIDLMKDNFERFTISQAALIIRDNKCLILKDAKYPWWLLPGGRVDIGENKEIAFTRELQEELGVTDFKILGVADYDIWYGADTKKPVSAIVNLVDASQQEIKLSGEHSDYKWIAEEELEKYEFRWPKTIKMIKNGFKYKKLLEKNG